MKILLVALFFITALMSSWITSTNQSAEVEYSTSVAGDINVMTGTSSDETYFRLDMILPIAFVIVSLLVLVPHKPIYDKVLILLMIGSLVGVVVNVAYGLWSLAGLLLLDLILAIITAVKLDNKDVCYLWRTPVIFIALAVLYLSA